MLKTQSKQRLSFSYNDKRYAPYAEDEVKKWTKYLYFLLNERQKIAIQILPIISQKQIGQITTFRLQPARISAFKELRPLEMIMRPPRERCTRQKA
jgi:hypothetical protein